MKHKAPGFQNINTDELPTLARVCHQQNDGCTEQTLIDLQLIDDCLALMRMKQMLNRRRRNAPTFRQVLDGRIQQYTNDSVIFQIPKP